MVVVPGILIRGRGFVVGVFPRQDPLSENLRNVHAIGMEGYFFHELREGRECVAALFLL